MDGEKTIFGDNLAYLFDSHEYEQSNLNTLIHLFTNDVFRSFEQYNKDQDWMALADSIWKVYSNYIGFSKGIEQTGDKAKMIKQFEQDTKGHFQAALNGTFADFYDLPKDHAVYALVRLLGNVKSDRDFEALCSPLTEEMTQKYGFLITRIEREINTQECRPKDAPEEIKDQEDQGRSKFSKVQDFFLEKIKQMPEDERERFLSINSGDRSFSDVGINWLTEFNNVSGKQPNKDYKTPLSNAKRQYLEERKS